MTEILGRPLTFGDKEQIDHIRKEELRVEFAALKNCQTCNGSGECGQCGSECPVCYGSGKEQKAYEAFQKANPGVKPWELR